MLASGGLGHRTKHMVNQTTWMLTGNVYDNVRFGAICCASDRSVLLKSGPKKSCCRIYSAVIFASCSFLTVRSGRPRGWLKARLHSRFGLWKPLIIVNGRFLHVED